MSKKTNMPGQATAILRTARVHFTYVAAYMVSIILFDSWNLITHEGIVMRWMAAVLLLMITTTVWYMARSAAIRSHYYNKLLLALIAADIIFAAYNVYWERGMASRAVALFFVPIISAAVSGSRRVLLATTSTCVAAYSMAAIKYYHEHYGEGFKIELYGIIILYCAVFFVVAGLLQIIIRSKDN